jgi:hypothetical protein
MSWTNIPNANLAIGAPIRSVDQLALRDNPIAIAEGATGAPRVRAEALNGGQSGSAPIFAARAWVNFDGTTTTPTIRESGNVSSVAKTGTGLYTINITNPLSDVNFAVTGSCSRGDAANSNTNILMVRRQNITTSSFEIVCRTGSDTILDSFNTNISVFR